MRLDPDSEIPSIELKEWEEDEDHAPVAASPPPQYHQTTSGTADLYDGFAPEVPLTTGPEERFQEGHGGSDSSPTGGLSALLTGRPIRSMFFKLVIIVLLVDAATYLFSGWRWQAERGIDADIAKTRSEWAAEKKQWDEQRKQWQREREAEDRRRKDVEMRRKGVYWAEPEGSALCYAYSTRAYTAVLKDLPPKLGWLEVCSDMPVVIHGRRIDHPTKCERKEDGSVVGTWLVDYDEPTCVPYWDNISDKGCAPGKSGMRRVQGRLWGIRSGDDWSRMCATTPATIQGNHFKSPTSCDHKGNIFGVQAFWDYPDAAC